MSKQRMIDRLMIAWSIHWHFVREFIHRPMTDKTRHSSFVRQHSPTHYWHLRNPMRRRREIEQKNLLHYDWYWSSSIYLLLRFSLCLRTRWTSRYNHHWVFAHDWVLCLTTTTKEKSTINNRTKEHRNFISPCYLLTKHAILCLPLRVVFVDTQLLIFSK